MTEPMGRLTLPPGEPFWNATGGRRPVVPYPGLFDAVCQSMRMHVYDDVYGPDVCARCGASTPDPFAPVRRRVRRWRPTWSIVVLILAAALVVVLSGCTVSVKSHPSDPTPVIPAPPTAGTFSDGHGGTITRLCDQGHVVLYVDRTGDGATTIAAVSQGCAGA